MLVFISTCKPVYFCHPLFLVRIVKIWENLDMVVSLNPTIASENQVYLEASEEYLFAFEIVVIEVNRSSVVRRCSQSGDAYFHRLNEIFG